MRKFKFISVFIGVVLIVFVTMFTVKALTSKKYQVTFEVVIGKEEQVKIFNQSSFYGNTNFVYLYNQEESEFTILAHDGIVVDNEKIVASEERLSYRFKLVKDTHFTAYFKDPNKHYVVFVSGNNRIISYQEIATGEDAVIPEFSVDLEGYQFVRWNQDITNVTQDLVVKPIYSKVVNDYNVTINIDDEIQTIQAQTGEIIEIEAPKRIGEQKIFSHWEVNGEERSINNILKLSIYQDLEITAVYSYAPYYDDVIVYLSDIVHFTQERIILMASFDTRNNVNITEVGILLIPFGNTIFDLNNEDVMKFTAQLINEANEFAISIPIKYRGYIAKAYVVEATIKNNLNHFNQYFSPNQLELIEK